MSEQDVRRPFGTYELGVSPSERKIIIAEILKELREAHGHSQRQVADTLEISPQTYNGWEKARNEPPVEYLVRLAYFYGVSMDIICGKEIPRVPTKQNIAEDIARMRIQIAEAEHQLPDIEDEEQRQQAETMLKGMWALVNELEKANKRKS